MYKYNDDNMSLRKIQKLFIVLICILGIILFLSGSESYAGENDYQVMYYENVVAITFDDGPRKKVTEELLDGLKERNVKATFFVVGSNAEKNKDLIERMYNEGHLIGNHTYTHIQLSTVNDEKAIQEIATTNNLIWSITGYTPKYIRPPFGEYNERVQMEVDMTPVLWSIDPNDWNTTNVGAVVNKVVSSVKNGDIILMHDIYPSSVEAALEIIDRLKAKGYVFVTVDQILLD